MTFKLFFLFSLAAGRTFLSVPAGSMCGRGFTELNDFQQAYFETLGNTVTTHPGYADDTWNTFKGELKCYYSSLVTAGCGGLSSQYGQRTKQLTDICVAQSSLSSYVKVDHLQVWDIMSDAERAYFKSSYPDKAVYSTMQTLMKKELLCAFLYTIDDDCTKFRAVRTE